MARAAGGPSNVGIRWDVPVSVIADGTEEYKTKLVGAIVELCQTYGAIMQAAAQANARWTDQTSNARQGLTSDTVVEGYKITLVLFHKMTYGIWLELANEGRYAIIMETIESYGAELISAAQELVR